jgi:ABC-2 type transport system ATP-binding protein
VSTEVVLGARELAVHYEGTVIGPWTLDLERGGLYGLIGANGAGKTSLLLALLGLVPTSGFLVFDGAEVAPGDDALLARVGWADDETDSLPGELTAHELWEFQAWARGGSRQRVRDRLQRAEMFADDLGLRPRPRQLIRSYSLGMRKKTQLVAAFLHDPALVLLDEPRNGLDPMSNLAFERHLSAERRLGTTFVVATHDLRYAEEEASHLVLVSGGAVLAAGTTPAVLGGTSLLSRFAAAVKEDS